MLQVYILRHPSPPIASFHVNTNYSLYTFTGVRSRSLHMSFSPAQNLLKDHLYHSLQFLIAAETDAGRRKNTSRLNGAEKETETKYLQKLNWGWMLRMLHNWYVFIWGTKLEISISLPPLCLRARRHTATHSLYTCLDKFGGWGGCYQLYFTLNEMMPEINKLFVKTCFIYMYAMHTEHRRQIVQS